MKMWGIALVAMCVALGLVALEFGVPAMVSAADAPAGTVIQLRCRVSPTEPLVEADFETEFCRVLASNLSRDLGATFELTPHGKWKNSGRAVDVNIHIRSASLANVTTSSGQVEAGVFTSSSTATVDLTSVDQPLRPESSRALVRNIGLQLGLIR